MTDRAFVNSVCAELPGAEVSDPWGGGHDCWKVGGKMFADIGAKDLGVVVKVQDVETATLLDEMEIAERAPHLRPPWILIPWGRIGEIELRDRIRLSYKIVRAGLPKKVQAGLAPFGG